MKLVKNNITNKEAGLMVTPEDFLNMVSYSEFKLNKISKPLHKATVDAICNSSYPEYKKNKKLILYFKEDYPFTPLEVSKKEFKKNWIIIADDVSWAK